MEIRCPQDMALAQRMIRERVEHYIQLAEKHYRNKFPRPEIVWSLKGSTAGKASAAQRKIWFHPQFVRENFNDYYRQTVGHEVAHLIQYWEFGYNEENTSHGKFWRNVMYAFQLPAKRCHSYDLSKIPTVRKARPAAPIVLSDGAKLITRGPVRIVTF